MLNNQSLLLLIIMINNEEPIQKDAYSAIISRRSIRRFKQKKINQEILKKMVNAARLAPSAANLQPLEFIVVNDEKLCSDIFETIGWAGYLKDWSPSKDEQPTAYIIILSNDTSKNWYIRDVSFASENIVLTAESNDLGTCILLTINKEKIKNILKIPSNIELDSIIALGYKAENPVLEEYDDTPKYWHDEKQVLHIPKRKLEDIIHMNKY